MKNYLTTFACIISMAFIVAGCTPSTYSRTGNGYYYNDNYGDGPLYDYYGNNQSYQYQQPASVSVNLNFNDFYNQLSPYGIWVNIAPYGQVWVANVPNFQPYSTNGYWAYTNYGWTWVSNYSWGWAPFHYGRWGYNNRYGWYWVPGYIWGPAWVAWSSSADMYGWAPLMPGMNYNVNLSINVFPSSYWTFMPGRYMGYSNIGGYYINRSRNVTIIKNTTIINNYGSDNNRRYSMGPSANDVQRYTGRNVQPMRISEVQDSRNAGVSNNELRVYRPELQSNTSSRTTSTPDNNRTSTQQATRSQPDQSSNSRTSTQAATQQATRSQPDQSSNSRTSTQTATQQATRTQPNQSATQQNATTREYRPNPAQPRVTNSAAPQTTKQIDAAQKDNTRTQQRSATTSGRR